MTSLTIYVDDHATEVVDHHTDTATIRERLASLGVEYERWDASRPLSRTADQDEVVAAYQDSIAKLNAKYGFVQVDVVSMTPDHPNAREARAKFLAEHTHSDFETRFFVDGSGAFYIHARGRVYVLVCTKGDLINLPPNTTHWFDMGPKPDFKAIRFFRIPEGWVGHFTGDTIAERLPKYEASH